MEIDNERLHPAASEKEESHTGLTIWVINFRCESHSRGFFRVRLTENKAQGEYSTWTRTQNLVKFRM